MEKHKKRFMTYVLIMWAMTMGAFAYVLINMLQRGIGNIWIVLVTWIIGGVISFGAMWSLSYDYDYDKRINDMLIEHEKGGKKK